MIRVVAVINETSMLFGAPWIATAANDLQRIEDDLLAAQRAVVADAVVVVVTAVGLLFLSCGSEIFYRQVFKFFLLSIIASGGRRIERPSL